MKVAVSITILALIALSAFFFMREDSVPLAQPVTVSQPIETAHEEKPPAPTERQGASIGEENLVEFACAEAKTMTAVFTRDILGLTLSDGRQITLRQAESDSGIRYLNNTQTIEFRGGGEQASLVEGGGATYANCVTN